MSQRNWALLGVAAVAALFAVVHLIGQRDKETEQPAPKPWYRRGTLDNATVGQWRTADPQDRVATCAGWLVDGYKRLDMQVNFDILSTEARMLDAEITLTIGKTPGPLEGARVHRLAEPFVTTWLKEKQRPR